jgi:hypothetical protein
MKYYFISDIHNLLIIKPTRCTNFSNFVWEMKLYMFRTVPLSIIRSYLITVHSAMVYVIQVCRQLSSSRIVASCLLHFGNILKMHGLMNIIFTLWMFVHLFILAYSLRLPFMVRKYNDIDVNFF